MLRWKDRLCSAHAFCIPAERAINNVASRLRHDVRVWAGLRVTFQRGKVIYLLLDLEEFNRKVHDYRYCCYFYCFSPFLFLSVLMFGVGKLWCTLGYTHTYWCSMWVLYFILSVSLSYIKHIKLCISMVALMFIFKSNLFKILWISLPPSFFVCLSFISFTCDWSATPVPNHITTFRVFKAPNYAYIPYINTHEHKKPHHMIL